PGGSPAHHRDDGQCDAGRSRHVHGRGHGRLPDQADSRRAAGRGACRRARAGGALTMDQSAIDRAVLNELESTTDAPFVHELIGAFLTDAPQMIADLRTALGAGNAELFRRTAHSLKSNSLTFGARALAAMARELEQNGIAPVASAGGAPLDALAAE